MLVIVYNQGVGRLTSFWARNVAEQRPDQPKQECILRRPPQPWILNIT